MSELVITLTRTFQPEYLWRDKGSGAQMDGAFWRPIAPSGYYLLGDYAQGNYGQPVGTMAVVKESGSAGTPALMPPTGFTKIYEDKKSGADIDGSIWMPTAPTGYIGLGAVANRGYDAPPTDIFRCVRFDLVVDGKIGELIWNDRKSGARQDVSTYEIKPLGDAIATGTFYAQGNFGPPSGKVHCLRPAIIKV